MTPASPFAALRIACLVALPLQPALAQHRHHARPLAHNVIIPQRRVVAPDRHPVVRITAVDARVEVIEQVAITTMDIALQNPTDARLEAEVVLPVPDGAVVRGFTFAGAATEPSAELLPGDEARRIYDAIVARTRDPALLEFVGINLIRSSVFPVEPRGTQKVRLSYEQVCPLDGDRVDYVLLRSEALDYDVPWHVTVRIRARRPIATIYSPTHQVASRITGDGHGAAVTLDPAAATDPGAFRLSWLTQRHDGVAATLLAYPDPRIGGGYFLMLAGVPAGAEHPSVGIKREVTLVLDHSGSMNGTKLDQVRAAALQIISGLNADESFNIIVFNEAVDVFSRRPVVASDRNVAAARAYLQGVRARGGTNIHDALVEALRQRPTTGALPIVLFLTDGRPTIGRSSERAIRAVASDHNRFSRRVFTFGVGADVNSPLLENIASATRATATFVLPAEDIELKVAGVFGRLSGPILADAELAVLDDRGAEAIGRVRDLMPARLPDLFDGDQLVLLGQYVGERPLAFRLAGNHLGHRRRFHFRFDLDKATTRNAFVPRLWASRKIGILIDAIRSGGADATAAAAAPIDAQHRELVDEIVRLSTEFGILTEYTAFLAREGSDLSRRTEVLAEAWRNFDTRA